MRPDGSKSTLGGSYLILEDGTVFRGQGFGAAVPVDGEVGQSVNISLSADNPTSFIPMTTLKDLRCVRSGVRHSVPTRGRIPLDFLHDTVCADSANSSADNPAITDCDVRE